MARKPSYSDLGSRQALNDKSKNGKTMGNHRPAQNKDMNKSPNMRWSSDGRAMEQR